jgi:hypothetical protein
MLSLIGLIGALALLIVLTIRGMNLFVATPLCALLVALTSGIALLPPLAAEGAAGPGHRLHGRLHQLHRQLVLHVPAGLDLREADGGHRRRRQRGALDHGAHRREARGARRGRWPARS